jgi:iron(III) transport system substrate-binding protein
MLIAKERLDKLFLCAIVSVFLAACSSDQPKDSTIVVVYTSEDQVFSEPILRDFERETGIKVKAVFDTEETKGTGVMNRLIAEKSNPQADVYWANEPIRAEVLKQKGIAESYASPAASDIPSIFKDPQGYWTGFSARARVFIMNKNAAQRPESILDYTQSDFKNKTVIANPLFGTTTVHVAALFTIWGEEKTKKYLADLKSNSVKMSSGNGESADLVSSGEFDFALVDSDDAISRSRQGKSVEMIYPDQNPDEIGVLLLPNAVLLVKSGPNPTNGKKLIDYLLSAETERKLAFADCAQIPLHKGIETPADVPKIEKIKAMQVDYSRVAQKIDQIQPHLKEWAGL